MLFLFMNMIDEPEDREKFCILDERYHRLLWQVANQILQDEYLAEDAVQNAYMTALSCLNRFRAPESTASRNFLVTIVRSRSVDLLRKGYHRHEAQPEELPELLAGDTPQDLYFRRYDTERLAGAIRQLEPDYRAVIEYFYLHDCSIKEIAALTHTTAKNITVRLTRARKKLKLLLEQQEGGDSHH